MCCFGRDTRSGPKGKERRCAHCGADVQDFRSLLFYGSVLDFCGLECQRRFVAEYFVRPADAQQHVATEGKPHGPR